MGEVTRDNVLEWMRKAFVLLKDHKKVSYGTIQREAAAVFIREHPELIQNGERLENTANRYYQNEPQSFAFVEAFWYLVTLGFILPEPSGAQPPTFDHLTITKLGREWAEGTEPSPEDQEGYLAALHSHVPHLDPVIVQYAEEAIKAYSRRLFFASAVMIGAANEKLVYLLMDALETSVTDAKEKAAIRKTMSDRGLPSMFRKLQHHLAQAKAKKLIPGNITECADNHLFSLQDAIRVQRNDAVHPIAGKVTSQTVRLSLLSFPGACKKVYDLIAWFQQNSF